MELGVLRKVINQCYLAEEQDILDKLLLELGDYDAFVTGKNARKLVQSVRHKKNRQSLIEAFLHEYRLNSAEGIIMMGIAEALLRIPDARTQDQFLQEKLTAADWQRHLQHSDSLLVNLSTGALLVTGKFEQLSIPDNENWRQEYERLLSRLGAPLIRTALKQAMRHLAGQFVIADNIESAIDCAAAQANYRFSFDMLGEAALTANDAKRFFQSYHHAIKILGRQNKQSDIVQNPSISIKLSALYPRYEPLQHARAIPELTKKLLSLAGSARAAGISLTVDAEESERLEMSLDIFAAVYGHPQLTDWSGLGLAVQAYQKRAIPLIDWLAALALQRRKKIPLRLVKGAYWDSEIKRAQENGLSNYPVFTHKTATDVAYLACAKKILDNPKAFYPQFATHNAHTIAAIREMGKQHPGFELQRLHGMGEQLYDEILDRQDWQIPCRIYAPVGNYRDLLPYLVRRLLENGANTSFINQVENPDIDIEEVINDPVQAIRQNTFITKQQIVLPKDLFAEQRQNSAGLNINDPQLLENLQRSLNQLRELNWQACPLINAQPCTGEQRLIVNPSDHQIAVGTVIPADADSIKKAMDEAIGAFTDWRLTPVTERAHYLQQAAALLESNRLELVSLCIREGGRTVTDALAEVREAVDFCRYYAHSAVSSFARPLQLPGPAGEDNRLIHYGRGVFVCISPWNFPIAIFIGQISAALASGNTVIAKPAANTPLTAMRCIQILHEAGIPENVLQFLPGDGATIGRHLLTDQRLGGVAFTGSGETARLINRQLAGFQQIKPLIAETGGQNVLLADSSALAEQLALDTVQSAFNSAGQRCSALRVLFLQQEIADKIITMLTGAMQELIIGDPGCYQTDIGPLINFNAVAQLNAHLQKMKREATLLYQAPLPDDLRNGSFFAPCLIEISDLNQLQQEVFGPVLHIIRYHSSHLEQVINAVNASGYGLTLGIHSRIEKNIQFIQQRVYVGNIYVNRNMIGAVVGVQPFGGMGLSGTGPKAGGPDYLRRFTVEQTVTVNTAAIGGNARLLARDLR